MKNYRLAIFKFAPWSLHNQQTTAQAQKSTSPGNQSSELPNQTADHHRFKTAENPKLTPEIFGKIPCNHSVWIGYSDVWLTAGSSSSFKLCLPPSSISRTVFIYIKLFPSSPILYIVSPKFKIKYKRVIKSFMAA